MLHALAISRLTQSFTVDVSESMGLDTMLAVAQARCVCTCTESNVRMPDQDGFRHWFKSMTRINCVPFEGNTRCVIWRELQLQFAA